MDNMIEDVNWKNSAGVKSTWDHGSIDGISAGAKDFVGETRIENGHVLRKRQLAHYELHVPREAQEGY